MDFKALLEHAAAGAFPGEYPDLETRKAAAYAAANATQDEAMRLFSLALKSGDEPGDDYHQTREDAMLLKDMADAIRFVQMVIDRHKENCGMAEWAIARCELAARGWYRDERRALSLEPKDSTTIYAGPEYGLMTVTLEPFPGSPGNMAWKEAGYIRAANRKVQSHAHVRAKALVATAS